jgi:anti-anti-sigma factor
MTAQLIPIERQDGITWLGLEGRLDMMGVQRIDVQFMAYTAGRAKPSVVDLSGVTFLGSLAIGMLFNAARTLHAKGQRMVVLGPRGEVQETLRTVHFHDLVEMVDSEEAALAALSAGAPPVI